MDRTAGLDLPATRGGLVLQDVQDPLDPRARLETQDPQVTAAPNPRAARSIVIIPFRLKGQNGKIHIYANTMGVICLCQN